MWEMTEKINIDVWKIWKIIWLVISVWWILRWAIFFYFNANARLDKLEEHTKSITYLSTYEVKDIVKDVLKEEFSNFKNELILSLDERYQKKN